MGIRVEPPTRITWSISDASLPQSFTASSNGSRHRWTRSSVMRSNSARVSFDSRWSGPSAVAVMNGRLIVVSATWLSSIFAFSAASLRRCRAILSWPRSTPWPSLKVLIEPVDDPLVPIVATELRIAVGGLHLEDALADLEQRNVERAAAEVEHQHGALGIAALEPVRERRGRGLVDDPEHLEAGDLSRFLRRLALGVVEVRRDGDDRLRDRVAQIGLGIPLQLRQDLRGDLLGGPRLPVDVDGPALVAHVALHRADRAIGIGDGLALGDLAHQDLAVLREPDHRRGGPRPLCVRDHDGLAGLERRDHRVRRAEVDADRSCHVPFLSSCLSRACPERVARAEGPHLPFFPRKHRS